MMEISVRIISRSSDLPEMTCNNFFHSCELFGIVERTPGQKPFMAVAETGGKVIAHMLAIVRRRGSLLPPYLYTQGRIYGEGEYDDGENQDELFDMLMNAMTRVFRHRKLCLYAEVSDISRKMFGYRTMRANGFFPVGWQEVHNSLHSKEPRARLSAKMLHRIDHCYAIGVETREAKSREEVHAFYKLLNGFYRFKMRRLIPAEDQFTELYNSDNAKIFITTWRGHIIGGCACVMTGGSAYMWYLASLRKRYARLHPQTMTIWQAVNYAWQHNYAHFFFLDVGLPYRRNHFRDFILSFGGIPVSKYRWFRFSIGWLNRLLGWFYSE